MTIAVARSPLRASQVTFETAASAIRLESRVKVKDDPRNFAPVGVVSFGVEETHIRDSMLLVIRC